MVAMKKYASMQDFLRHSAADLAGHHGGSIGIIGRADGPTAIFVASKKRPAYDGGCVIIRPALGAMLRAFAVAGVLAGIAVGIFRLVRHSEARR